MVLGIMQPYLFPYIGYFQLISAVDQFAIHDDVQWIKGGWIARNRILVNGQSSDITLPVRSGASSLAINQRVFVSDIEEHKSRLLRRVHSAYRTAPHFEDVYELLFRCLAVRQDNVSQFVVRSLREVCNYLRIDTPFIISSGIVKNNDLRGQDRVIDINLALGASHYLNPSGGCHLYEKKRFLQQGILLEFLSCRDIPYAQFPGQPFIPRLSIIDTMMFNSTQQIADLLNAYDLT